MDVKIRAARSGDGEGLARLWVEMGQYYTDLDCRAFQVPARDGLVESFEEDLSKPPPEDMFSEVAEHAGELVGWIYAKLTPPQPDAPRQMMRDLGRKRLMVDALVVTQRYWRHGIGTQLMEAAEEWARTNGADAVFLHTYVDSPTSVPFYERRLRYTRRSLGFWKDLRGG